VDKGKAVDRWRIYKLFRKLLAYSLLSVAAIIILFLVLLDGNRESIFWNTSVGLLVLAVVVFVVSVLYTTFWPCPKCGKSFTIRWFGPFVSNIPLFNYCGHCGYEPEKGYLDGQQ
jgi:hypothetical protein